MDQDQNTATDSTVFLLRLQIDTVQTVQKFSLIQQYQWVRQYQISADQTDHLSGRQIQTDHASCWIQSESFTGWQMTALDDRSECWIITLEDRSEFLSGWKTDRSAVPEYSWTYCTVLLGSHTGTIQTIRTEGLVLTSDTVSGASGRLFWHWKQSIWHA